MRRSLLSRIETIEQAAAPLRVQQERERKRREARCIIERALRFQIDKSIAVREYTHGRADSQQVADDVIEMHGLIIRQLRQMYGEQTTTEDQFRMVAEQVAIKLTRHIYMRIINVDECRKDQEMYEQVKKDMALCVPSAESGAAEYFRQLECRYPRNIHAKRLIDIMN